MTNMPPPDENESWDPSQGMPNFPTGASGAGASGGNMPPGSQGAAQPVKPRAVKTAVQLMLVGAALTFITMLLSFTQKDDLEQQVRNQLAEQPDMNQATIDSAVSTIMPMIVIVAVVTILCWLWMAWKNGQGRNWARILSTVLAAIGILFTLVYLTSGGGATLIMNVIMLVVEVAILVMLWRGESTAYYRDSAQARFLR